MKSFLFLTELFLAAHDGALADVVMTHGAGEAVGHSTSPATASHRKRKKPPRWLQQPQQQETESDQDMDKKMQEKITNSDSEKVGERREGGRTSRR
jgi:hypothetical protein